MDRSDDLPCLDVAPWSADERERLVATVLVVYDLTSRLLSDLDAAAA